MDDQAVQDWVDHWAVKYQPNWDDKISGLAGKEAFSQADVACVYEWKFRRMWPKRKIGNMMQFPEERVLNFSRRAFRCPDELGALSILTLIPGAAAAGASALLTAHDPARYTVMGRTGNSFIALAYGAKEGLRRPPRLDKFVLGNCGKSITSEGV
jgi:hypothetical protein